MNSEIQYFLSIMAMGVVAWLIIIIITILIIIVYILCFHFPRKCDNCGKLRAFKSTRSDSAMIYTAGGFMVSDHHISQKKCVSCGFESEPKLVKKTESFLRD